MAQMSPMVETEAQIRARRNGVHLRETLTRLEQAAFVKLRNELQDEKLLDELQKDAQLVEGATNAEIMRAITEGFSRANTCA